VLVLAGAILGGTILGAILGGALVFFLDRSTSGSIGQKLGIAQRDLGEARRSLESARELGRGLERGLVEAQGIARGCTLEIERAIGAADRIVDSSSRVVVLSRAVREVTRALRGLAEGSARGERTP